MPELGKSPATERAESWFPPTACKYAALLNAALADTELQERMRTRALEASRRYDLENIGNQWLSLFNEM